MQFFSKLHFFARTSGDAVQFKIRVIKFEWKQIMERYLTIADLRIKLGNRIRSAIYNDLAANRLPPPLKLGGRILWREAAIDAHLRELEAAK